MQKTIILLFAQKREKRRRPAPRKKSTQYSTPPIHIFFFDFRHSPRPLIIDAAVKHMFSPYNKKKREYKVSSPGLTSSNADVYV
jgi:hypothetical protein